ncbi:MAG TPA: hypothetical protein VF950_17810 [Planctomycetota bacterium]
MNASRDKALEALRLADSAFKDLDDGRVAQLTRAVLDALATDPARPTPEPEGFVALVAPRKLDAPGEKDPWPVLVAYQHTPRRAWEADLRQNTLLIATDLRNGDTAASVAFRDESDGRQRRDLTPRPSRTGPPPNDPPPSARTTGVDLLDLRRLFPDFTKEPRRLALAVVYHDWPSNVAVSERLDRSPSASRTTARRSPFIKPGDAQGEGAGTTLILATSPARGLEARGTVDADVKAIPVFEDEAGAWVSPITILFLKLDDPRPVLLRAQVPVRGENGRVRGAFSLSVGSALPHADLRGSYQVYLVAGAQLAGPYPLDVHES